MGLHTTFVYVLSTVEFIPSSNSQQIALAPTKTVETPVLSTCKPLTPKSCAV